MWNGRSASASGYSLATERTGARELRRLKQNKSKQMIPVRGPDTLPRTESAYCQVLFSALLLATTGSSTRPKLVVISRMLSISSLSCMYRAVPL